MHKQELMNFLHVITLCHSVLLCDQRHSVLSGSLVEPTMSLIARVWQKSPNQTGRVALCMSL